MTTKPSAQLNLTFGLKPSDHFKTRLRKQKTEDTITRLDPTDVIHSLSHSASPVGHGLNNDKRMDDARPGVKNDSRAGGRNVVDKDGIHLSYPRPFDGDGGYENNGYDDYGNSRNEYYAYDPNSIHYDPSQSHQGPSPKMFKIGPKDSGQ